MNTQTLKRNYRTLLTLAALATIPLTAHAGNVNLLNVSYDPTREFYQEYNAAFASYWNGVSHQDVIVKQSHGGSGKQARAIVDGLEGDVATLALGYDIDAIEDAGLINHGWEQRLPYNSSPYTSTIVLVVRKGNPKHIHDFGDLARPGVSVIVANPKTSGGARWAFLAAYGYALKQPGGNDAKAQKFIKNVYTNVAVLDSGARGSTTTFVERGIGDVLVAWEDEAFLVTTKLGKGQYEIVVPKQSILAEPPVAVVDKVAEKHGTQAVATAYLRYIYSPVGQEIAAKHFYRPRLVSVARKYANFFPKLKFFTIDNTFGGWRAAQQKFFSDGGVFDQIYKR